MSIGPLASGIYATAAGSQLAQSSGSDVERARQDAANAQRAAATDRSAENAAGIAETDGKDHETNDRDADGRRPWEIGARGAGQPNGEPSQPTPVLGKDASGSRGNELDLTG